MAYQSRDNLGEAACLASYLTDVLEVLDVHPLGVHDLLDDVGPHLVLALRVFVAGPAGILLLLLALRAAGILRQLFLVDAQLQCTQGQGWGGTEPGRRPPDPPPSCAPGRAARRRRLRAQQQRPPLVTLLKSFPSTQLKF